jgi:hypothetical protein
MHERMIFFSEEKKVESALRLDRKKAMHIMTKFIRKHRYTNHTFSENRCENRTSEKTYHPHNVAPNATNTPLAPGRRHDVLARTTFTLPEDEPAGSTTLLSTQISKSPPKHHAFGAAAPM